MTDFVVEGVDFELIHAEFDTETKEQAERERDSLLKGFWNFYNGEHRKFLKIGEVDDNVIINFCSVLVDRSVSRLFGDPFRGELLQFDIQKKDESGDTTVLDEDMTKEVTRYLEDTWERSGGLEHLYNRIGVYGGVTGHFIMKLMIEEDGPRVTVPDTGIVDVLLYPDDRDKVRSYKIQFKVTRRDPEDGNIKEADFRQLIVNGEYFGQVGWYVQDFLRFNKSVSKDMTLEDTTVPPEWIPVSPIDVWDNNPLIDGQNLPHAKDYWGFSDMSNVTGLNDEINFVMSNVNRIIRYHAHPRTVAIGVEAGQVTDTAIESFWTIATTPDKAEIVNLEMKSDLAAIYNFFQVIREAFWTIGREADPATFKEKIGNVTNFGLRVLFLDALNKLGQKRQTYGKALSRVIEHILSIGGYDDLVAIPQWNDPLPTDPKETVETLAVERGMGIVSRATAARERGRNWEKESKLLDADEQDDNVAKRFMRVMRGDGSDPTDNVPRPEA